MPEQKQIVTPFNKEDILTLVKESGLFQKRIEVTNVKAIPGNIIDELKCGDVVVKRTVEDGKVLHHAYIVTHRQPTGICLTYSTTGYSETQSYDYTEGKWVYNSEDKWTAE